MTPIHVLLVASLNGWSMRQLATRAHVSQACLSGWLRGESGRLSERSVLQVFHALELDEQGQLKREWVYRWRLGDGGGSELDLKDLLAQAGSTEQGHWEEFPLLQEDGMPIYLAFRTPSGLRILVQLASKNLKFKNASLTKLEYPTAEDLGSGVRWGATLVEGSEGIILTPDQIGLLQNLSRRPTPELFDALLLGQQCLGGLEVLQAYEGLTWEDIMEALKRRYSRPEVAGFFLGISP